jgi:ribose transport system permease protein
MSVSASAPAPARDADHTEAHPLRRAFVDHPLLLLGLILLVLVVMCALVKSSYLSGNQAGAILRYAAPLAIMAGGQTLVMLTAGIDLSVGATATAAAYVMAGQSSGGALSAIVYGLAVGLVVGLVNGVGVGIFRVQPLIMTLGIAGVITGLLTVRAAVNRTSGHEVPTFVRDVGGEPLVGFVPNSLLLWIAISAVLILVLRRTGYGRMLYAYGDNPMATRLAGVRAWQLLVVTYALCGMLAAVSGMLLAGLLNAADLGLADSFLLPSVAAVVLGGTSLFGGVGTYSGTIMGALILTVLDSFLTLINADDSVRQILYGLIILALAALYARVQRHA